MFLLLSLILTYLQRVIPWQQSLVTGPACKAPNCYSLSPTSSASASASSSYSYSYYSYGLCLGGAGGGGFAPAFTQFDGKKPFQVGRLMAWPNHQPFSQACSTKILSPFSIARYAIYSSFFPSLSAGFSSRPLVYSAFLLQNLSPPSRASYYQ